MTSGLMWSATAVGCSGALGCLPVSGMDEALLLSTITDAVHIACFLAGVNVSIAF